MSRIGKKPIEIPEQTQVIVEGQKVTVKGPRGQISREVLPEIKIEKKENNICLSPTDSTKRAMSFWGLERSLISNMVSGVINGFEKKLEIRGVGYKATVEENELVLEAGFSHLVRIKAPEGIQFSVEGATITVSGIDKEKVGQTAAKIRKVRPPDSYKGKGIRYLGEEIKLKPGKKAVSGAQ